MRHAIAEAPVGDDQFGEDPSVNTLQALVAELLGKEAALAAPFGLVSIALSKGLGFPGGSVLAGTAPDIAVLQRYRRMLGGAMRQAGVLAAAGAPDAAAVVARAGGRDVKVLAFGPRTVRAVTHLDVGRADCERAAEILSEAVA